MASLIPDVIHWLSQFLKDPFTALFLLASIFFGYKYWQANEAKHVKDIELQKLQGELNCCQLEKTQLLTKIEVIEGRNHIQSQLTQTVLIGQRSQTQDTALLQTLSSELAIQERQNK